MQDQQLYRQSLGAEVGKPEQLTRVEGHRFADAAVDERRARLLAVREDHTGAGEAVNTIVAVCAHPVAHMRLSKQTTSSCATLGSKMAVA